MGKLFSLFGKLALILIIVGAIGFGGYYLGTRGKQAPVERTVISPTSIVQVVKQEPTVQPSPAADESENLLQAIKQALALKYPQATSLTVTVSEVKGNYAKGMVTEQGGGGMWFGAKLNGAWKLVTDGNGITKCSEISAYPDLPVSFLPQCWDEKAQKLVER